MTVLFSTLLRISPSGVRAPLLTITPPSKRSSAFGVSSTPAAAPSSCSFASRGAMRGGAAAPGGAAALPSDLRGADAIALEEMLVRIFLATHRVLRRAGVFAPKGQRVDPHLLGELVHRRLERERSFNVARRTKSGERSGVGDDLVRLRGQIRDVVERVRRTGGIGDPPTLAHVGPRGVLDRRDSAGLAADPELLQGRGAVSGGDVLLFAREDAADWPYQLHREERSDDRVLPHPALGTEAAAHVIAEHA